MNSVRYYRDLVADPVRIEAFRRAIHRVVRPGDRVLEVGTGLGTFAFFAADAGASQVYAVEGHPIVHIARAIGRLNGYHDRVDFIRGWFPHVELPDKADVVIFEDFPPRLLDARVCGCLRALEERYAAGGFRVVPSSARWFAAPVSSTALWDELSPFGADEERHGINWGASREYAMNQPADVQIPPSALVGPGCEIGGVEFAQAHGAIGPARDATWVLERDAVVHGLAYWFDLEVGDGELLSNAPGAEPGWWRHLFLPVDPPVEVPAGGTLVASVGTDAAADGLPTWLHWALSCGGESRRGHEFGGFPASLGDLRASSPDAAPRLSATGRRKLQVLGLVDGRRTLEEIARAVAEVEGVSHLEAERLVVEALRGEIPREAPSLEDGTARTR